MVLLCLIICTSNFRQLKAEGLDFDVDKIPIQNKRSVTKLAAIKKDDEICHVTGREKVSQTELKFKIKCFFVAKDFLKFLKIWKLLSNKRKVYRF